MLGVSVPRAEPKRWGLGASRTSASAPAASAGESGVKLSCLLSPVYIGPLDDKSPAIESGDRLN